MSDPDQEILTVSQITGQIRGLLQDRFARQWVRGEISNLTRHRSGHWYFSLKDADAQLGAVMFRGRNRQVPFTPAAGMEVMVHGDISVYAPQGRYQIVVDEMLPRGEGDLHIAFEALKRKLDAEGLFAPERKRVLPKYPERIGIVTSPTGAAIQDMLQVMGRRFPLARMQLFPARVQGADAAREIVAGIEWFNLQGQCEVLIVGRGGGSLEDLWAFNEEPVVRAITNSQIPVISAVGHEIDYTLSDLAADLRAPTPSAAAELVVPDGASLLAGLSELKHRVDRVPAQKLERLRMKLERLQASRGMRRPWDILQTVRQQLDHLLARQEHVAQITLDRSTHRLELLGQRLLNADPLALLDRGYSMVTDTAGKVIRTSAGLEPGNLVRIRFAKGKASATVKETENE